MHKESHEFEPIEDNAWAGKYGGIYMQKYF
jgi:hypothetical protein